MVDWSTFGKLLANGAGEAANGAGAEGGSGLLSMLLIFGPVLLVFIVLNALLGAPDRKERARRQQLLSTLRKNDQIVTIGGIYGTVVAVSDDKSTVTIRVDDQVRIKIRLDAVREVVSRPGEEAAKES